MLCNWFQCRKMLNWPTPNPFTNSLTSEIKDLMAKFSISCRSSDIAKLAPSNFVWSIWGEHNNRIFNKISKTEHLISKQIIEIISIRISKSKFKHC